MNDTILIAIADDHAMFRQGIVHLLPARFKVVIQSNDGTELLEMLAAANKIPDICIVDIHMKPMNGYEALKAIKHFYPDTRALALTAFGNEFTVISAMKAGADAYINKEGEIEDLVDVLEQLYEKGFYVDNLDPVLTAKAIHGEISAYTDLGERELGLLRLCCSDLSYAEIADKIHISKRTLENDIKVLFNKLGVSTRSGLVAFAMLNSLGVDDWMQA